jgi:hypothetical protein
MGVVGQTAVTAICGAVRTGQVALTVLLTATPQTLRPVAVEVLVLEQLVGAI